MQYGVGEEKSMACKFISQLSKLRKSSAESVDNITKFDDFKKYLHVERQIERDLKVLLRQINKYQDKCLVLLCGSAGDGKSHLISYLKNADSEHLLNGYEPYNDATESAKPTMTSIDTLAVKLSPFNDENLHVNDGKKMIVAINLGTLNNFIDSEKSNEFSELKKFVRESGIVSGFSNDNIDTVYKNSIFQYVSFADTQIFSLGETGLETTFLEQLIAKVFDEANQNPFYQAHLHCQTCAMYRRCPVCHNFIFLSEPLHQKALIKRIIEVVVIDKEIISTRDVLNLIYDLVAPSDFDDKLINLSTNDVTFLETYVKWTTPMLLNEYEDVSSVIDLLKTHDILLERSTSLDNDATHFHILENIKDEFSNATEETPYSILSQLKNVSVLGGIKPKLKKVIYRFIVRLRSFTGVQLDSKRQKRLNEFIKYLYLQNSGKEKKLGKFYEATKKAVRSWNGHFEDEALCIDDTNERLYVLENLPLKAVI